MPGLEARLTISGKDATGDAFASIKKKIDGVAAASANIKAFGAAGVKELPGLVSGLEQAGVGIKSVALHAEKAEARIGRLSRAFSGLGGVAGSVAPLIAGAMAFKAGEGIIGGGAHRIHEKLRMEAAGMTPEEIESAEVQSARLAKEFPAIGQTETMHMLRNMRSIVGSYEEAANLLEPVAKLRIIAQANRPGENVAEDFDQLIKGLEIKGVTHHPEQFRSYMEGIAKGLNTFGDTLKPYQYYEMFKYGRQATPGLSERFILGTAPSLAQELGGSSYGRAVSAFNAALIGGVMKHASFKEFAGLGLIKPEDIRYTPKTHEAVGLMPGAHIAGWQLAQSDPNEWVKQYLIPALREHGVTSDEAIRAEIPKLFQNQMAAQMVGILATQQSRIDKDLALLDLKAKGLEAAAGYQERDPSIAWEGLKKSVEGLASVLGAQGGLAEAMNAAARGIGGYTNRLLELERKQKRGEFEDTEGQKKFNRWMNVLSGGPDSDKPRSEVPMIARNETDWKAQHDYLKTRIEEGPTWIERLLGTGKYAQADRIQQLSSIDEGRMARREAEDNLTEFERNRLHEMEISAGRPSTEIAPGLLAFQMPKAEEPVLPAGPAFSLSKLGEKEAAPPKWAGALVMAPSFNQGPNLAFIEGGRSFETSFGGSTFGGSPITSMTLPPIGPAGHLPMLALGGQAPVMAKLDGQANIAISLSLDEGRLEDLIKVTVESMASGDVRSDTGMSMPNSMPGGTGKSP